MELADGGALDSALAKLNFPMKKKYTLIYQAALGLAYIHGKNLMHRDVAARNCLYGGGQVKISDFGLSREGVQYTMDLKKKVPIRWLPPETIRSGLYTPKTDVFSFGVMAWEITEDGKEPYPGLKVVEVAIKVLQGYRQPFSPDVNQEFANYISKNCYPENYEERTTMDAITKWMKGFLKAQGCDTGRSTINVLASVMKKTKASGEKLLGGKGTKSFSKSVSSASVSASANSNQKRV
uniref:Protein kinase domain-containing protein n=1 Tax=Caenorhabditis japonica TaxID=281687 RepID=A0A8R1DL28_CAEJA